ncbi:DUF423 domain-containing protein [Gluconacetobacter entanii]|uniref:DUF423 domain-containing protein n=1 Tax=Gluconacetobacter entanii TaxID=108528 RepID=UPI00187B9042|nr:DUF423 domain-containing protein [Gluconacetobacter entanii]MBE7618717.1 DUF423 domain-containing protein [Komagataeibacter sp. FXV2]MBY4639573.1 DUF423 domain-containing protein [Gluconacetobacter entanii]MCW4580327.1 DUF423 domain-containing protein [Gluconacetobacter entanii]MCW4583607.1 DUF423 domain-containing protein [Gluconacetobacter entanii]MCW4587003.1 DUF423 domain-containing protein [Gluconacetobacter entanii]
MPTVIRFLLSLAAFAALLGVVAGAFVAHLPDQFFAQGGRDMARQAIQMEMWHALALLGIGVLMMQAGCQRLVSLAGCAMALGMCLFCGAVYFTAITGVHLGPVAPTGGSILMLSWLLLAVGILRS